MDAIKCPKCNSPALETFQRGQHISGTRCLACQFETLARVCRTVDELRAFIEGLPGSAVLAFQDDQCYPKLEAHFPAQIGKTERVKVWKGSARE